jgi:diguanylate cyclase (GGDEF)-like protein
MVRRPSSHPRGAVRAFAVYAAVSLVAVVVLGVVLAASYRVEARRRGVAEGRSEAQLLASTAVEPLLDGRPLSAGLTPAEVIGLKNLTTEVVGPTDGVLRLRLRDLKGQVVYSDDGSGYHDVPEDEALDAAAGHTVARLTRLNSDSDDSGPIGPAAVEVYLPLTAVGESQQIGVLEIYLPYAPISRDVTAGLDSLYLDLAIGLVGLYVVLVLISLSVSRGLRRQVALNAHMAEHDALTGLGNRALFHRRVAERLKRSGHGAVAIMDLDRFRSVNDTLGHHNGDRLLIELAARLAGAVDTNDTVARMGGDEFGILLADSDGAERELTRLRQLVNDVIIVSGLPVAVEASIGFAVAPDDGGDADALLQHADVAMYIAKSSHAGIVRYDPAEDHYDPLDLSLIGEFPAAIEAGQLVLHYQPKKSIDDGSVEALEALVRWNHPTLGLLGPDRFLPLAEQTELIHRFTRWVILRALTDLQAMGPLAANLSVAVNVSARDITEEGFAAGVQSILAETNIPAERLIVEMTETALLVDPLRAAAVLADLARTGVRISIDDFGCGQTSLGYLSALPIHELKIDKSFVTDMTDNEAHAVIVRSIVDLGHNLALRVVAEGVETEAVLTGLRTAGCDVAQGYLFARAMPPEQLLEWLASDDRQRRTARVTPGQARRDVAIG